MNKRVVRRWKIKNIVIFLFIILFILYFLLYAFRDDIKEVFVFDGVITRFDVPQIIYLAKGDSALLNIKVEEKEGKSVPISFKVKNKSVLGIKKNKITGLEDGESLVVVTAGNKEKSIKVVVSSLITKKTINNDKPYVICEEYSKEEEELLESILVNRVEYANEGTRGAALAVARFILLEFRSGIRYFNENGRLENHSNILKIDAEGRYYHKGLYLSIDDYEEILYSTPSGPAMWGCPLHNNYLGKIAENGLNCSGFISWVLYNAGYDIKDVGAGDYDFVKGEFLDLKPQEEITIELLNSGKVKPGDLIGLDGHIAIIIGIENDKIYVGESYETGLRVLTFTYDELLDSEYTTIILMDTYYKSEGIYTNMW